MAFELSILSTIATQHRLAKLDEFEFIKAMTA